MKDRKRKYIYLSNKYFDGTVYKTQIIDWLDLFSKEGIVFELYQIFHIKDILKIKFWMLQIRTIKNHTKLFKSAIFFFPSKGIFVYLNSILLFFRLFWYLLNYDDILIFTRGLLGKELRILKKVGFSKFIFYFDARAASAEENKYAAIKRGDFSLRKYMAIAHIFQTEYKTLITADMIFAVSEKLIEYFEFTYNIDRRKFILYPCLSEQTKFYYSEKIRNKARKSLKIPEHNTVLLYSGGLSEEWHITREMFAFFNTISENISDITFLVLTKDNVGLNNFLKLYPRLIEKSICLNAKNEQVFEFLNAADFGILFRENTIMNNVASPSKYAEYILCGLPVIISEGVGDFSKFTIDHRLGQVLKNSELKNPEKISFYQLFNQKFDRLYISQIGIKYLSKNSILNDLVKNFSKNKIYLH